MNRLMKRFLRGLSMLGFAVLMSVTVAPSVNAAIITSTTDLFEGATVTDSIAVGPGGFSKIFLGGNPEAEFTTNVLFPDAFEGTINFVNFSTASPVSIAGVRLTAGSDGWMNSYRRSMNRFVLKADLNNDSTYETTLIDQAIATDYSLQAGNVASGENDLDLTFNFAPVTAAAFRAEFTQGVFDFGLDGVRVYELDAIAAPAGPVVVPYEVPKTGQTTSYAPGDDGDLKKGVAWPAPRFTDNGNGTVTDNLTGLIWLKNADCFGAVTWANAPSSANTLASNACGLTDNSVTGDWRLPNINELESLIDAGNFRDGSFSNVLPTGHPFSSVQDSQTYFYYWSSTSLANDSRYYWGVSMLNGRVWWNDQNNGHFVWPVRGGQ